MEEIPIEAVLLRYSGTLPLSDTALLNIVERLDRARKLPPKLALESTRHPMRVIQAVLPEFDLVPPETLASACGQSHIVENTKLTAAIFASGEWVGELPPPIIRQIILEINAGTHPDDAFDQIHAHPYEREALEFLLELEDFWEQNILDLVLILRRELRGIRRYTEIARHLGTWKIGINRSWHKRAKAIEKELRR